MIKGRRENRIFILDFMFRNSSDFKGDLEKALDLAVSRNEIDVNLINTITSKRLFQYLKLSQLTQLMKEKEFELAESSWELMKKYLEYGPKESKEEISNQLFKFSYLEHGIDYLNAFWHKVFSYLFEHYSSNRLIDHFVSNSLEHINSFDPIKLKWKSNESIITALFLYKISSSKNFLIYLNQKRRINNKNFDSVLIDWIHNNKSVLHNVLPYTENSALSNFVQINPDYLRYFKLDNDKYYYLLEKMVNASLARKNYDAVYKIIHDNRKEINKSPINFNYLIIKIFDQIRNNFSLNWESGFSVLNEFGLDADVYFDLVDLFKLKSTSLRLSEIEFLKKFEVILSNNVIKSNYKVELKTILMSFLRDCFKNSRYDYLLGITSKNLTNYFEEYKNIDKIRILLNDLNTFSSFYNLLDNSGKLQLKNLVDTEIQSSKSDYTDIAAFLKV